MPKPKAFVKVTAERYGWTCTECNQPHSIFEVPSEVRCSRCGEEYRVGARITRFIPPVELELSEMKKPLKLSEPFSVRIDRTGEQANDD